MRKVKWATFRTCYGDTITSVKYGWLVSNEDANIPFEWNNSYKTGGHYQTKDGSFATIKEMEQYYNV